MFVCVSVCLFVFLLVCLFAYVRLLYVVCALLSVWLLASLSAGLRGVCVCLVVCLL